MATEKVFTPLTVIQKQMEQSKFPFWAMFEPDGTSIGENYEVESIAESYEMLCERINDLEGTYVIVDIKKKAPLRAGDTDAIQKEKTKAGAEPGNQRAQKIFRYRVKLKGYQEQGQGQGGIFGIGNNAGGTGLFTLILEQNKQISELAAARREDELNRKIADLEKMAGNTDKSKNVDKIISGLFDKILTGMRITKDGIEFGEASATVIPAKIEDNVDTSEKRQKVITAVNNIIAKLNGNELEFFKGIEHLANVQPEVFAQQAKEIIEVGKVAP